MFETVGLDGQARVAMSLGRCVALAGRLAAMGCAEADGRPAQTPAAPPPPVIVASAPPSPPSTPPLVAFDISPQRRARGAYLTAMHNRIHPGFMTMLFAVGLEPEHGSTISCDVDLTLDPTTGVIETIAVLRSSSRPEFDAAVLKTVAAAAPFASAPKEMISDDGRVHLHWQFYDNPVDACSTRGAVPMRLPKDG